MATHLWRRGTTWTFQFNVPKSSINRFGATPFRINLGAMSAAEAGRYARVLAGYATVQIGDDCMSRETVNRGLAEVAAQLASLKAKATTANFAALRASAALAEIDEYGEVLHSEPLSEPELEQRLAARDADKTLLDEAIEFLDTCTALLEIPDKIAAVVAQAASVKDSISDAATGTFWPFGVTRKRGRNSSPSCLRLFRPTLLSPASTQSAKR